MDRRLHLHRRRFPQLPRRHWSRPQLSETVRNSPQNSSGFVAAATGSEADVGRGRHRSTSHDGCGERDGGESGGSPASAAVEARSGHAVEYHVVPIHVHPV